MTRVRQPASGHGDKRLHTLHRPARESPGGAIRNGDGEGEVGECVGRRQGRRMDLRLLSRTGLLTTTELLQDL